MARIVRGQLIVRRNRRAGDRVPIICLLHPATSNGQDLDFKALGRTLAVRGGEHGFSEIVKSLG